MDEAAGGGAEDGGHGAGPPGGLEAAEFAGGLIEGGIEAGEDGLAGLVDALDGEERGELFDEVGVGGFEEALAEAGPADGRLAFERLAEVIGQGPEVGFAGAFELERGEIADAEGGDLVAGGVLDGAVGG
nr:hypothetical protein [Tepidiforma sp.]